MLLTLILSVVVLFTVSQRYTQTCSRDSKRAGYYWDGQQCLKCKEPQCLCTSYQGCDDCIDNFYLDPNGRGCLRCPYGCAKCCKLGKITSVICISCLPGFQIINGVCVQEKGCIRFSDHGHCIDCTNFGGYFKSQDQKCLECPDGCKDCLSESYCRTCKPGYFKDNQFNETLPESNSSIVVCKLCNSSTSTNLGPGCMTCEHIFERNTINCTSCFQGYYFEQNNSICIPCPPNCKTCNEDLKCEFCLNQKIPDSEGKTCRSCQETIPHCLKCLEENNFYIYPYQCETCDNEYYSSTDFTQCLPCIKNSTRGVRRCDDSRKLTQCQPGYVLIEIEDPEDLKNLTFKCLKNKYQCRHAWPNGSCIDCESENGYLLSLKEKTETEQLVQCVNCKKSIENCKDCVSDQDYTITCLICMPKYFLDTGKCYACTPNCSECSSNKSCIICDNYFYLNSTQQCSPCGINECKVCNETNSTKVNCLGCTDSWGLDLNNKCWECQVGCKTCNYHRNVCTKCNDYYYLYMGSCIPYPKNCLKANSLGFCYLCNTTIQAPEKGKQEWDELWNEKEYYFEEQYKEETDEVDDEVQEQYEETSNKQESIFYMSVNSYCLVCSNYDTGQYQCPDNCLDDTFIIIFSYKLLNHLIIVLLVALVIW